MEQLLQRMLTQNPWWEGKEIDTGIPREQYLTVIKKYLRTKEILLINGVRRSGKTTILHQTINYLLTSGVSAEEILFISCDSPELLSAENTVFKAIDIFRKKTGNNGKIWLFLDEVQAIDDFPRIVKTLYDEGNTHLIISGSTSYLLESKAGTLLSGRYLPLTVHPLNFKEYLRFTGINVPENELALFSKRYELIAALERYMKTGGFPAVVMMSDEEVGNELMAAYYDSIVYRDIIQAHNIRSSALLAKLLMYLITNISSQVSVLNLSKVFSCNARTIDDFLEFAQDAYLIYLVPYFTYSLKTQTRMLAKSYLIDTGIRHAVSSAFSPDTGKCMENIVCIELIRRGYKPAYWTGKNEVDFVVRDRNHELTAINVCYTDEIPEREFAGLNEFESTNPEKNIHKILLSEDTEDMDGDIQIIPLWKWLLQESDSFV